MFSLKLKNEIAEKVQKILKETKDPELSTGEINFLLHVDGVAGWSWANIRNNSSSENLDISGSLKRNITVRGER